MVFFSTLWIGLRPGRHGDTIRTGAATWLLEARPALWGGVKVASLRIKLFGEFGAWHGEAAYRERGVGRTEASLALEVATHATRARFF